MINSWKLGLKSIRYAYGKTSNCIMMIVFFLLGLVFYAMPDSTGNGFLGGYMLMCVALMPVQMLYSLSVSNLVQSSPFKKKMQTSVPAVFACVNMLVLHIVNILIHWGHVIRYPASAQRMTQELLMQILSMLFLMVYMAVAYKFFVISMCLFIGIFGPIYVGKIHTFGLLKTNNLALWQLAVLGLVVIAAGGVIQYMISLLIYKAPMSKMAQSPSLRKEL